MSGHTMRIVIGGKERVRSENDDVFGVNGVIRNDVTGK